MLQHNYPYLKNYKFLKRMDESHMKEIHVKITVLDWQENPIEDIEGLTTGGSINFDGNSAVRATGNLSLVLKETSPNKENIKQILTINKKIYLQIGYTNNSGEYSDYPIIWIPIGIFVVNSPSFSHSTNSLTMSMQIKDKMCLLNGDVGGVIPAPVLLNEKEDFDDNGNSIITKPTIFQLIQELVNHFGGEQISKIIINDVPLKVKQVMKWTGEGPIYRRQSDSQSYEFTLSEPTSAHETLQQNDDIGFIYTDFVYPGELMANAGDTVVAILDKIKNALGNYEYFYDENGNFVFQEIKNYLNTSQATTFIQEMNKNGNYNNNQAYLIDRARSTSVYDFSSGTLISSYSVSPQWTNIKNDFLVWGVRTTIDNIQLPVRYHLAIDEKPQPSNDKVSVVLYEDDNGVPLARLPKTGDSSTMITVKDWRTQLLVNGLRSLDLATDAGYYYAELANEWRKIYNLEGESPGFKESVTKRPYEMDYFLDFIDSDAAISEFSVSNIGRRTKVINDSKINCLFEPDIPDVVLIESGSATTAEDRKLVQQQGYKWSQVSKEIYDNLAIGGTYNSAFNLIKDLLYQNTNYNETIQLQAIPVYYLRPNTRITVNDPDTEIHGDYVIKTMSIPLAATGTMSISATKALEKI